MIVADEARVADAGDGPDGVADGGRSTRSWLPECPSTAGVLQGVELGVMARGLGGGKSTGEAGATTDEAGVAVGDAAGGRLSVSGKLPECPGGGAFWDVGVVEPCVAVRSWRGCASIGEHCAPGDAITGACGEEPGDAGACVEELGDTPGEGTASRNSGTWLPGPDQATQCMRGLL